MDQSANPYSQFVPQSGGKPFALSVFDSDPSTKTPVEVRFLSLEQLLACLGTIPESWVPGKSGCAVPPGVPQTCALITQETTFASGDTEAATVLELELAGTTLTLDPTAHGYTTWADIAADTSALLAALQSAASSAGGAWAGADIVLVTASHTPGASFSWTLHICGIDPKGLAVCGWGYDKTKTAVDCYEYTPPGAEVDVCQWTNTRTGQRYWLVDGVDPADLTAAALSSVAIGPSYVGPPKLDKAQLRACLNCQKKNLAASDFVEQPDGTWSASWDWDAPFDPGDELLAGFPKFAGCLAPLSHQCTPTGGSISYNEQPSGPVTVSALRCP